MKASDDNSGQRSDSHVPSDREHEHAPVERKSDREIVMQLGGMGGLAAGALFESVRLWWRRRGYRRLHEEI